MLRPTPNSIYGSRRQAWFSSKNNEQEEKKDKPEEAKKDEKEPKQAEKGDKKKEGEASSTSSSEDEDTPSTLSKDDVKKIKKLITDQDKEIEELKAQLAKAKEGEKTYKDKLIYQLAENDNTVKRYKKEIDNTRDFAISKFAKELLEVRDNLQRAQDHIAKCVIDENTKAADMKVQVEQIKEGIDMTSKVMDSAFKKFNLV